MPIFPVVYITSPPTQARPSIQTKTQIGPLTNTRQAQPLNPLPSDNPSQQTQNNQITNQYSMTTRGKNQITKQKTKFSLSTSLSPLSSTLHRKL